MTSEKKQAYFLNEDGDIEGPDVLFGWVERAEIMGVVEHLNSLHTLTEQQAGEIERLKEVCRDLLPECWDHPSEDIYSVEDGEPLEDSPHA